MSESNVISLTQSRVESLPIPAAGRVEYRDAKQPGLYLRVTSGGAKSWRLVKRSPKTGKLERITLGAFPAVSVGQARDLARQALAQVIEGQSPMSEKKRAKTLETTFGEALDTYLNTRTLKDSTREDYRRVIRFYVPEWLTLPLVKIDEATVKAAHKRIGERSPTNANHVMRVFRAVWRFAREEYKADGKPVLGDPPTAVLSAQRLWNRETRKSTTVPRAQLGAWYRAVDGLQNRTARDYLLTVLLTGLRKEEAAGLQWADINFEARTLTVLDPKNHNAHTLPLSGFLVTLLRSRQGNGSEYVFPGKTGGKLDNLYKSIRTASAAAGFEFRPHDLRRTFATVSETLGFGGYTVKRLLNHAISRDVTGGYICLDAESLREPMERISEFFLTEFGLLNAEVTPLRRNASGRPTA
jgi:integrase